MKKIAPKTKPKPPAPKVKAPVSKQTKPLDKLKDSGGLNASDTNLFTEGLAINSPSALLGDDVDEAAWVKSQGWTPIEFLTHMYRNVWQEPAHRISAAKAILDYVHKKLPQKIELDGNLVQTKKLNAESLSRLSDAELTLFTQLLEKMDGLGK